jgi:hypothetical protein
MHSLVTYAPMRQTKTSDLVIDTMEFRIRSIARLYIIVILFENTCHSFRVLIIATALFIVMK